MDRIYIHLILFTIILVIESDTQGNMISCMEIKETDGLKKVIMALVLNEINSYPNKMKKVLIVVELMI